MRALGLISFTAATLLTFENACAQSRTDEDERDEMHGISLKCPASNASVLEYVSQNMYGRRDSITGLF